MAGKKGSGKKGSGKRRVRDPITFYVDLVGRKTAKRATTNLHKDLKKIRGRVKKIVREHNKERKKLAKNDLKGHIDLVQNTLLYLYVAKAFQEGLVGDAQIHVKQQKERDEGFEMPKPFTTNLNLLSVKLGNHIMEFETHKETLNQKAEELEQMLAELNASAEEIAEMQEAKEEYEPHPRGKLGGLPVSPSDIRKTMVEEALRSGKSPEEIKKITAQTGYSGIKLPRRYSDTNFKKIASRVRKMVKDEQEKKLYKNKR